MGVGAKASSNDPNNSSHVPIRRSCSTNISHNCKLAFKEHPECIKVHNTIQADIAQECITFLTPWALWVRIFATRQATVGTRNAPRDYPIATGKRGMIVIYI